MKKLLFLIVLCSVTISYAQIKRTITFTNDVIYLKKNKDTTLLSFKVSNTSMLSDKIKVIVKDDATNADDMVFGIEYIFKKVNGKNLDNANEISINIENDEGKAIIFLKAQDKGFLKPLKLCFDIYEDEKLVATLQKLIPITNIYYNNTETVKAADNVKVNNVVLEMANKNEVQLYKLDVEDKKKLVKVNKDDKLPIKINLQKVVAYINKDDKTAFDLYIYPVDSDIPFIAANVKFDKEKGFFVDADKIILKANEVCIKLSDIRLIYSKENVIILSNIGDTKNIK